MSQEQRLTFPVVSFRHLENPFQRQGYRDYFTVVATRDLPDLSKWRKINVRAPKMKGYVPKRITESFRDNPEMFLFMNRGIVVSAASVSFDQKASTATITLKDPNEHGLLDGGHTYNIVLRETASLEGDQYVKLEILEGFNHDTITQLVDARNTSNQVRDESLLNLAGGFEDLKRALRAQHYFDLIAFSEYEVDSKGNPKPIDVREVIALLTAFDRDNFNEKTHPLNAYRSKAACIDHFKVNRLSYRKLYRLAPEILQLHDHIYARLPHLYNKARGETGELKGGKFGKLTGVSKYQRGSANLNYAGTKSDYGIPAGFIYPILAGFRALLRESNRRYIWGKTLDPVKLLEGDLGLMLAETVGNFALEHRNPSKTGKSIPVWQSCYQLVENAYLRA